jgi:hypothetical protein
MYTYMFYFMDFAHNRGGRYSQMQLLKVILSGFILTALLGISTSSFALASCAEFNIEEAINKDDAIFSGKVIKIEPKAIKGKDYYNDLVLFEVDSIWKGINETQVILKNDSQYDNVLTSVDQHFEIGESYLIYAYKRDTYLQTNPCKGTKFLSKAGKDLSFLGDGKKPTEKVDLENSLNPEEIVNEQDDAIFGMKSHHLKNKIYVMLNIAIITAIVIVSCYLLYRIWNRKKKKW